jgi:hypothetical protein
MTNYEHLATLFDSLFTHILYGVVINGHLVS